MRKYFSQQHRPISGFNNRSTIKIIFYIDNKTVTIQNSKIYKVALNLPYSKAITKPTIKPQQSAFQRCDQPTDEPHVKTPKQATPCTDGHQTKNFPGETPPPPLSPETAQIMQYFHIRPASLLSKHLHRVHPANREYDITADRNN